MVQRSIRPSSVSALLSGLALVVLAGLASSRAAQAAEIEGDYLEARTCDVYTGPCFANAQVGLTGQQAILAWSIDQGTHQGVDLAGLKVILAIRASDTLGYGGGVVVRPDPIKSVVLVDERATLEQQAALVDFARTSAGNVAGEVVRTEAVAIDMKLDHVAMVASLNAGKEVNVQTRKLERGDCVCSNEEAFYPPLTLVENSEPAFTLEGDFAGRGLGMKWTTRRSRSAYLATFAY